MTENILTVEQRIKDLKGCADHFEDYCEREYIKEVLDIIEDIR